MEQDIKQEIVSIHLDNESTIPLYVQLYRHIKQMIEQGKLSTNFKMPRSDGWQKSFRSIREQLSEHTRSLKRTAFDQQVGQRQLCG